MPDQLTRQQLYDLMWSEPAKTIAPRFGISDVALSKLCKRHEVPQPPRGYWAKVAAGKRIARLPLPKRGLGIRDVIVFGAERWSYPPTPMDPDAIVIGPEPSFPETLAAVTERARAMVGKVTMGRDLGRAHVHIQARLTADDARRAEYLSKSYRMSWDAPLFDSPFEKRRLRVINALMLGLARAGAKPSASRGKDLDGFSVTVGHETLFVKVDEHGYARSSWRSTNDLTKPASTKIRLAIDARTDAVRTVWEDKDDDRVEGHLTEIAVAVLVAAEAAYRAQQVSHHQWLIGRKAQLIEQRHRQAEERTRKEQERLAAEEKARIDKLLQDAENHRRANEIRDFVAAVQLALPSAEQDAGQLARWRDWALHHAALLDPITSGGFSVATALPAPEAASSPGRVADATGS